VTATDPTGATGRRRAAGPPGQGRALALLLGPAYLWLTVAVFLPLSVMLVFSVLTEVPIGGRTAEFTLEHYAAFFEKDFYRTLTWRSLRLGIDTTVLCAAIGFPAALALARAVPGRWREALFLLVVLPFWSNALVRVFSWTMVFQGNGLVDRALRTVFPDSRPMDVLYTYPAIVTGLVHSYLPYMVLTCYLSLQAVDERIVEAARSLGATGWQIFWRIWLPLGLPGLLTGAVLIFVPVIGSFMEPRILGGRQGTVLGTVIEDQFTAVFNWPLGAALSFTLLAIVLLAVAVLWPFLRHRVSA